MKRKREKKSQDGGREDALLYKGIQAGRVPSLVGSANPSLPVFWVEAGPQGAWKCPRKI